MRSRMVRAQVQLTREQVRRLKSEAGRAGVSFSEMVRRCVDHMLSDERVETSELYRKASELVGAFSDPHEATDLSIDHDRYLEEQGYR